MPKIPADSSPRLRATQALPLATLMLLAVLVGTPGRHDAPAAQAPAGPAGAPALRHRFGSPAASRSRYPKSCAASTYRGRRPRLPPPRAPAASPAIKDSTTHTPGLRRFGSAASIATAATLRRPLKRRRTSGRSFPGRGEARPTQSGRTPS